jgi:predicted dehydrogenase
MTAYRKYFEPAAVALKKLITGGTLGQLKLIHTAFTFNLPAEQVWHLRRELAGGGSLWDVGVYCINTVRWLTGLEPVEATGYSWTADPARFKEVEESIAFQLKFPGGLCVQASSSFAAAKASFLQIHGEKGWAALDPAYAYNEERRLFGQIGAKWFGKIYKPIEEFHLELDHLAECILANRDPEPDGITGLRDVAIMEAIYEAANSRRPVNISLPM